MFLPSALDWPTVWLRSVTELKVLNTQAPLHFFSCYEGGEGTKV